MSLAPSDQQVWKKVRAAKNMTMTKTQLEASIPGMQPKVLTSCVQMLIKLQLLSMEKGHDGSVVFRAREPDDARKKQTLTEPQKVILGVVRTAGNRGISIKGIHIQIGKETMPLVNLRKTLEQLEKEGHLKTFRGINAPTLALYILPHLKPPEEIAGGIWFDNTKDYDKELVDAICRFLYSIVYSKTYPNRANRTDEQKRLISNPINPTAKISNLPTPHVLLKEVTDKQITSAVLQVRHVMECMRRLELDGVVEAVKPLGGVEVPTDYEDDDDDEPANKRAKMDSEDEEDEQIKAKKREKEKQKQKMKAKELKAKERKRYLKELKEKEKEKRKRKKAKEKEREREKRRKNKKKQRSRDATEDMDDGGFDSEELVEISDAEKDRSRKSKSKKSSKSKKRHRDDTDSDDDSDDSDDDSDSDTASSDTESISSIDTDDLDAYTHRLENRHKTLQDTPNAHAFLAAGTLRDLSDTAVVYRATSRLKVPLGQMQVPCGGCPQFAFCEDDGPVNAKGCEYYDGWLVDRMGGWEAGYLRHLALVNGVAEDEVEVDPEEALERMADSDTKVDE